MDREAEFYILAVLIGTVQGGNPIAEPLAFRTSYP